MGATVSDRILEQFLVQEILETNRRIQRLSAERTELERRLATLRAENKPSEGLDAAKPIV